MMNKRRILFILSLFLYGFGITQETEELISMSLEDILNMNIISASKKAENVFDSPLSASVINRDDIINSGATTFEELFRLVPGLIVREESNGNYDIHLRGYDNIPPGNFTTFSENTMTLVMIDGRKVFNHLSGGTFWETLPLSLIDIERIEIIRGPATALHGPNAVTGVIHFITRKTTDRKYEIHGNLTQGYPNTSIGEMNGFYCFNEDLTLRLSAYGEKRERFEDTYYEYLSGKYIDYNSIRPYQLDPSIAQQYPEIKDPNLSKKRWGSSARIYYNLNESIQLDFSGGYQDSRAQTVFFETFATPYSFRTSQTTFLNLNASIYGFQLQVNNQTGNQNIKEGFNLVTKLDMRVFDSILEYAWKKGSVNLRPGISWQEVTYSDKPYLSEDRVDQGYLNAEQHLNNLACFLRAEYQPVNPLRVVAAIRVDNYNYPDTTYINYQFAGTYHINQKNLVRLVYSRGNRGPFFMDVFTDIKNWIDELLVEYKGNHNLKLPIMDMIELGWRSQPLKNVQSDLEIFYNETTNLTSFEPYIVTSSTVTYPYLNIPGTIKQFGLSCNFNFKFGPKWQGRFFGTVQKTRIENFDWKTSPIQFVSEFGFPIGPSYEKHSFTHKNTPAFIGGYSLTYQPSEKWTLNSGLYYLGRQIYRHDYAAYNEDYGQVEIKSKIIPTIHVSYQFYKKNAWYVTLKNFAEDRTEFGFAESIGPSYFTGLRFIF